MQFDPKKLAKKAIRTAAIVIFVGGSLHLLTITIAAIVYRTPNLLNPADVLGIKTLLPQTEDSTGFYFSAWAALIIFYLFVFRYEHIKSHRYINSIREFILSISFSKSSRRKDD